MDKKPKILLSSGLGKEKFYVDAVESAGGIAVAEYCPQFSTDFDGLILCGGNDINSAIYGEKINGSVHIDNERDEAEIPIAKAFIAQKKPVLGICRGYQLLNALLGGSLIQHLSNADIHRSGTDVDRVHDITVKRDSLLYKLYKSDVISVNSAHHQAIAKVGEGLSVTAFAEGEIPEAFRHESLPVFGVQFHPERMCCSKKRNDTVDGIEIFKYFVDLCR